MTTTDLLCERDRLMESAITLDGKPAKLAGRLCAYGTVWSMTDGDAATMQAVDFSWPTIQHVIAIGGHFRS